MALRKCPKCELNYIREGEQYCNVCMRAMKNGRIQAEPVAEEEETLCSECGEAPVVRGYDLCANCLREQKRQAELENAIAIDEDEEDFEDEEPDEE
ncbi:MAG: hypothetical protein ACI4MR_03335 [Candidatus Aphodomorpha sp.]|nr:hypothetical protein [bacterium]